MTELFGMQAETLEAIIVALGTSFIGTGTVAIIVKAALGRVTRTMKEKVMAAEQQNKITTKQAQDSLSNIKILEEGLKGQVEELQQTIEKLILNQIETNKSVDSLIAEYKARDEQIKDLIVKEFGEDIE